MAEWTTRITDETALAVLRALYVRHGQLSAKLIDSADGMPGSSFYFHRFRGLIRAYAHVGYVPPRDYAFQEGYAERRRQLKALRAEVMDGLREHGASVERESNVVMVVDGWHRLAVLLAYTRLVNGKPLWEARIHVKPPPDRVLIARRALGESAIQDYCLVNGGPLGSDAIGKRAAQRVTCSSQRVLADLRRAGPGVGGGVPRFPAIPARTDPMGNAVDDIF